MLMQVSNMPSGSNNEIFDSLPARVVALLYYLDTCLDFLGFKTILASSSKKSDDYHNDYSLDCLYCSCDHEAKSQLNYKDYG